MTYHKTTTPTADPETTSQASGDDPFDLDDIPDFLRRTPGKTKRRQQPRTAWHVKERAILKTGKRYNATAQRRC